MIEGGMNYAISVSIHMAVEILTIIHVIISLVAIASGFVVVAGWLGNPISLKWTLLFLWTTIATSVSGFLFPFKGFTPAFGFGVISMIVLPLALYALHGRRLQGRWKNVYRVSALIALYLNTFALVVQLFLKVPFLKAIAPAQTDPPFAIAQILLLALFLWLGFKSVRGSNPA